MVDEFSAEELRDRLHHACGPLRNDYFLNLQKFARATGCEIPIDEHRDGNYRRVIDDLIHQGNTYEHISFAIAMLLE